VKSASQPVSRSRFLRPRMGASGGGEKGEATCVSWGKSGNSSFYGDQRHEGSFASIDIVVIRMTKVIIIMTIIIITIIIIIMDS
jgi:hypothetical protein